MFYNFKCLDCSAAFEEFARSYDPDEVYPGVSCPGCGSARKKKVPSLVSIGHTSSKMDNFGYRAGFFMERAEGERRVAEAASGGDTNPYPEIDDISSGEHFGEVK